MTKKLTKKEVAKGLLNICHSITQGLKVFSFMSVFNYGRSSSAKQKIPTGVVLLGKKGKEVRA